MGRPRVKIIDDSKPQEEVKKKTKRHPEFIEGQVEIASLRSRHDENRKQQDSLVDQLKEELGIEQEKLDAHDQTSNIQPQKPTSKIQHPTSKTKPRGKKYLETSKDLDRSKFYPLPDALDMVKKLSYAKFKDGQGTLEAHINTTQTGIRGLISLPFASGKKIRILAFGKGADTSGADLVGDDSIIDQISQGKIDFDLLITTPDWMLKLAKMAKTLGPRGLMPNPKNGTITDDLKKAVESFQAGKTEYKTEAKGQIIHLGLGKLNQPNEELAANIKTLLQTLGKTRISKVTLSPTMGASVKLDLAST